MSERRTPMEVDKMEVSRKESDSKFLEGDEHFSADLVVTDKGDVLKLSPEQIEEIRNEMKGELRENEIIKKTEQLINHEVEARIADIVHFFEEKMKRSREFPNRLHLLFSEEFNKKAVMSEYGVPSGQRQSGIEFSEKLKPFENVNSPENTQHIQQIIFSEISGIILDANINANKNIFGGLIYEGLAKELLKKIEENVKARPDFDPYVKSGLLLLQDFLTKMVAALRFDDKHSPDAVHIMGVFDPALRSCEKVLKLAIATEAKLYYFKNKDQFKNR